MMKVKKELINSKTLTVITVKAVIMRGFMIVLAAVAVKSVSIHLTGWHHQSSKAILWFTQSKAFLYMVESHGLMLTWI